MKKMSPGYHNHDFYSREREHIPLHAIFTEYAASDALRTPSIIKYLDYLKNLVPNSIITRSDVLRFEKELSKEKTNQIL